MIDLILQYGGEIVLVKVSGCSVLFGNTSSGAKLAPISGLKLSKAGVEKEFPDLIDHPLWKEEAVFRFKEKIKALSTEKARANYIIKDLQKHGYTPKRMQESGKRVVKL